MDEQRTEELKAKLNAIEFEACGGIEMGDILHYHLTGVLAREQTFVGGLKTLLKLLIRSMLETPYTFTIEDSGKTVCLFSRDYVDRADHRKAFLAATDLLHDKIVMASRPQKIRFKTLKYLKLLPKWNWQMKPVVKKFRQRMTYIDVIMNAYLDYEDLLQQCKKNKVEPEALLTYCDVMPTDNYFTQHFNLQGKKTVTLQHGFFQLQSNSWAYTGSRSQFFLANSQFSAEQVNIAGCHGHLLVVGSPHSLYERVYICPQHFMYDVFGIIMNSSELTMEDNRQMISVVQSYCKKYGKKLLIKYHPTNRHGEYQDLIDSEVTQTYGKEILLEEFGEMIDVAIVSASTGFTTMLNQWKPTFVFVRQGRDMNTYGNVDDLKFYNEQDLEQKVAHIETPEMLAVIKRYRNYFLASGNIKENYLAAYRQIGLK